MLISLWPLLAVAQDLPPVEEPGAHERPLHWVRYPVAAAEGALINLSLNLTVRYIVNEDWAKISIDSIRQNGETGWMWDEDLFATNQLAHPYHGAAFHNVARVHSLTYWEALPIVALGSWEWERFLETDAPSINDQINTTLSGALFGELMWKLSGQVLDASTSGRPRLLREVTGTALDPIRGLDRVLTGKAWRPGPGTVRVPMRHALGVGFQAVGDNDSLLRLQYRLAYGEHLRRPLDRFELQVDGMVTAGLDEPGIEAFVTGALVGDEIGPHHLVGLFQSYDYVQSPLFGLGGTAVGPGWWADVPFGGPWSVSVRWTAMFLPTGAVDSPYALRRTERSYLFGIGGTGAFRVQLGHERLGHVFAEARGYTVHSPIPPVGEENIGWVGAGVMAQPIVGWGVGFSTRAYAREGVYAEFEPHRHSFVGLQLSTSTAF